MLDDSHIVESTILNLKEIEIDDPQKHEIAKEDETDELEEHEMEAEPTSDDISDDDSSDEPTETSPREYLIIQYLIQSMNISNFSKRFFVLNGS